MVNIITSVEKLFEVYSFAKEFILVVIGAILAAVCTTIINNGAMRKQCKFNVQYDILKNESDNIKKICKQVENLEIALSFTQKPITDFSEDIQQISHSLLLLNESLREQRKFVRKYLKAIIVEKSAQYVNDYTKIFYIIGDGGIFDLQIKTSFNNQDLNNLRLFETNIRKFDNEISECLECLISPHIWSKIQRKFCKPIMLLEECIAIFYMHRKK